MAARTPLAWKSPATNGAEPGGALRPTRRLDGPLLRPDQAAELLAVKPSWIYEAVRTRALPCIRVGRHIRFTRAMLEEWLQER